MWVKLGNDFLNLDRVVRVRFSTSRPREGECLVAEIESAVDGEIRQLLRYRKEEAEALQAALAGQAPGRRERAPGSRSSFPAPALGTCECGIPF